MTASLRRRRLAALEANRPASDQERLARLTDAELDAELEALHAEMLAAGCDPAYLARTAAMTVRELDQELERLADQ